MALFKKRFGKSKNDKMKWFIIIGAVIAGVYYFLFNTVTGQGIMTSAKNAVTPTKTA